MTDLLQEPAVDSPSGSRSATAASEHHGHGHGHGHGHSSGSAPRHAFRPDVEGLRAVAVVLVVLDHLVAWPRAGFIGVDVFFVISGFLITGLLLDETTEHGRLSFGGFYLRRARRILPAALTVLLGCFVAAHVVFRGSRVHDTVTDIGWALGFSANIHFEAIGTQYFASSRPPSLVQHFWSLAVEEQFYLVWPVVILIVLSAIGRVLKPRGARTLLLVLIVAGSAASFAYALHQTVSAPDAAYFSTVARAWELGVGAAVAVALHRFPALTGRLVASRGPLLATGLLGIGVAAFVIRSDSGFPAPAAALPVLGTALILFAGAGDPLGRWSAVLTNPISRYIGRVSFSLYLWHWPVILVAEALMPEKNTFFYVVVISAITGLTVASYHLVETQLRKPSAIWQAARTAVPSRRRRSRSQRSSTRSTATAAVVAATLLAVSASAYALQPPPPTPQFVIDASIPTPTTSTVVDPDIAQPSATLAKAVLAAVQATAWPKLNPPLSLQGIGSAWKEWAGCRNVEVSLADCTFETAGTTTSAAKTAVVIGDSISLSWLPTVRAALLPAGWTVIGLAREACAAADVSIDAQPGVASSAAACDAHHRWMIDQVAKIKPSLVILSSTQTTLNELRDGATGTAAQTEYQAGMEQTERRLAAPGRRIVTLSPPPGGKSLATCATATALPSDCVLAISSQWRRQSAADRAAAAATDTTYLDTSQWFCLSGYCPSFVGTTPVYWDGRHLTEPFAESLGVELASAVKVSTASAGPVAGAQPSPSLSTPASSQPAPVPTPSVEPRLGAGMSTITELTAFASTLRKSEVPVTIWVVGDSTGTGNPGSAHDLAVDLGKTYGRPAKVLDWNPATDAMGARVTLYSHSSGAPITVVNASAVGQDASFSLQHLAAMTPSTAPSIMIINHGHNQSADNAVPQVSALAARMRSLFPDALLAVTLQNGETDYAAALQETVVKELAGWASEQGLPAIDVHTAFAPLLKTDLSDGKHPNTAGHVVWEHVVRRFLLGTAAR